MAMIFFIGALAVIIVLFGGIVKGGLCQASAQSTNMRIANAINQVINSPLEDERRVLPLETSLAIGESKSSRYSITISKRTPDKTAESGFLIISTQSEIDPSCASALQVSYPKSYEFDERLPSSDKAKQRLFLVSSGRDTDANFPPGDVFNKRITILPSLAKETTANRRSEFIVVMGCTSKTVTREKHFFVQDCALHPPFDPKDCINFDTADVVENNNIRSICSFG